MKNCLIFLVFLTLNLTLFAKMNQKEKILFEHVQTTAQILLHAPEAMLFNEDGKCYIDEQKIIQNNGEDSILLQNGNFLTIPKRLEDQNGSYLLASLSAAKKLFKCICNHCSYEWYGGVFTVRCPACGSSDFRVVYDGF